MAGKVITELRKHYVLRQNDVLMTRILASPAATPRVALLSGPPGTGKTFYAECLAKAMDAKFIMYQLHAWTSAEELVRTPNVASFANANLLGVIAMEVLRAISETGTADVMRIATAVFDRIPSTGDEPAWLNGVLWATVIASQNNKVVLCLDEIDKAYERTEYALLEFLDRARFTLPSGEVMQSNAQNLVVIITTNDTRELHEATLRRCYRHKMTFLPERAEASLVVRQSGVSPALALVAVKEANAIRKTGLSSTSTKEIVQFCDELRWCITPSDIETLAKARLYKGVVGPATVEAFAERVYDTRKGKST